MSLDVLIVDPHLTWNSLPSVKDVRKEVGTGKVHPYFEVVSRLPDFVKLLFDVQHYGAAVLLPFERFQNAFNKPVALFWCSMAASEAKLVIGAQTGLIQYWQHSAHKYSFEFFSRLDWLQVYQLLKMLASNWEQNTGNIFRAVASMRSGPGDLPFLSETISCAISSGATGCIGDPGAHGLSTDLMVASCSSAEHWSKGVKAVSWWLANGSAFSASDRHRSGPLFALVPSSWQFF